MGEVVYLVKRKKDEVCLTWADRAWILAEITLALSPAILGLGAVVWILFFIFWGAK